MKNGNYDSWDNDEGFFISIDKKLLDRDLIYNFMIDESYWAKWFHRELIDTLIDNSTLCFGIYKGNPIVGNTNQVGFARVVSDLVRFAYLADVFVIKECRGLGLSKWLMSIIVNYPFIRGVTFMLGTDDAHSLYAKYGFKPVNKPEGLMFRPLDVTAVFEDHRLTNLEQ